MNTLFFLILSSDTGLNVWDLAVKGGWLMIPIFILSVIGIYILCERWYFLYKVNRNNKLFIKKVEKLIKTQNHNTIIQASLNSNTPVSDMLYKGVKYKKLPIYELRSIMENSASISIAGLEKGFSILASISSIAPMIGFLGTVIGMVQAFYDMSLAGSNINITLLSRGIYTAMITTVAGLIVGIITLFGYNLLVAKTNQITDDTEQALEMFIEANYQL